jgi:hypothetical protein
MCFFSLHNECPPVNYATAEAMKVTDGLVAGEEATSSMLRAMGDCLQAMAYMVDTGGGAVATFGEMVSGAGPADPAALETRAKELRASYDRCFDVLAETVERITFSVQKYRELGEYARGALEEGRGVNFEQALVRLGNGGFDAMVQRRIEFLRRLKVRVQLLRRLQPAGAELLATNQFADFFLWFMQPIRDVNVAVHELYGEALRGALESHTAVLQTCRLVGEELPLDAPERLLQGAALDGQPVETCAEC